MARTQIGIVSFVPKGDYDDNTTYTRLNLVEYNGSGYVCKLAEVTGIPPTNKNYWMELVSKPVKGVDYWTEEELNQIVQEIIHDSTNEFNVNVINKTSMFNENADSKLTEFNQNTLDKTREFNSNANDKEEEFNSNVESKLNSVKSSIDTYVDEVSKSEINVHVAEKIIEINTEIEEVVEDSIGALEAETQAKLAEIDANANVQRITNLENNTYRKNETYNKTEINDKLKNLDDYAKKEDIPTKVSELDNDSEYVTNTVLQNIRNSYVKEALVNNNIVLTDEEKLKIEMWLGLSENYLTYYNGTPYVVSDNYNPAHKKYVDEKAESVESNLKNYIDSLNGEEVSY